MKITALESRPHKPGMYRVSIDDKPVGYVGADDVLELDLAVGQEIGQDVYVLLLEQVKFRTFYFSALRYADRRLHSKAEVERYLKLHGCDSGTAKKISATLERMHVIDEGKLAQAYVHDAVSFKPMSKKALAVKLRQKKIDPRLIESAIDDSDFSEADALDRLIDQKRGLSAYANNPERFFRYLISKGFSYEEIVKRLGCPVSRRKGSGRNRSTL